MCQCTHVSFYNPYSPPSLPTQHPSFPFLSFSSQMTATTMLPSGFWEPLSSRTKEVSIQPITRNPSLLLLFITMNLLDTYFQPTRAPDLKYKEYLGKDLENRGLVFLSRLCLKINWTRFYMPVKLSGWTRLYSALTFKVSVIGYQVPPSLRSLYNHS